MRKRDKRYALDQCALYSCQSKKRLFKILQTSSEKYAELRDAEDLYRPLLKKKKNGDPRLVHAPRFDLKRIQTRLNELLMRIEPPDFLMSPVRRRSNIDNAEHHRDSVSHRLIDIADFYPSCSANKVAEFFGKTLRCPPDVVAILVRLTTKDGALPQGSPASPILAYFSYKDMWDEITKTAHAAGNRLTVYVDDVTISGSDVLGETLWAIKQTLWKHGHKTKDAKEESKRGTPVTVTGVVLRDQALLLPNVQHRKRHALRKVLESMPEGPDRLRVEAAVVGHEETEKQILKRARK